MLKNFMNRIWDWLRPSVYIGGLGDLFILWHKSDAKGRGILLLCFAPMFICIGGMLFSVVSFVLFVLPSFVLKFLGWLMLVALFSAGGKYCYRQMMRRCSAEIPTTDGESFKTSFTSGGMSYDVSYTDVKYTDDEPETDEDERAEKHDDGEKFEKAERLDRDEKSDKGEKTESGPRRTIYRRSRTTAI